MKGDKNMDKYYKEQLTMDKTDKNYHIAEYVKSHDMSLLDFDCWSMLQAITGNYEIDYETYHAVDSLLEDTIMDADVALVLAAYDMVTGENDESLLPCPFCGNRALYLRDCERKDFKRGDALRIECPNCKMEMWEFSTEMPETMQDYDSRFRHLVRKWNTRFEHGA